MERTKHSVVSGAAISLREEHKRVTRDRLVAAAETLFQEHGYRATTVEQIAKTAGTTVTTFYRHFKSKSELAVILQTQLAEEVLAVLRRLEEVPNVTRKAVRNWVNQYFDMWQRVHVLCEAYWEAAAEDPELAAQSLPTTLSMTSLLTELLEKLAPSVRARAQLRLSLLVLALDRIAFLVHNSKDVSQRAAVLDEFAEMIYVSVFRLGEVK